MCTSREGSPLRRRVRVTRCVISLGPGGGALGPGLGSTGEAGGWTGVALNEIDVNGDEEPDPPAGQGRVGESLEPRPPLRAPNPLAPRPPRCGAWEGEAVCGVGEPDFE